MRTISIAIIAAAALAFAVPVFADEPAAPVAAAASVAASTETTGDPAEKINRVSFAIHETLDRYLFRPAALAYRTVVPKPARVGLENVLSNLGEPVVFINDTLQGHFHAASVTVVRFAVNSTVGVGGLFDIGARTGLPPHDNGFALTLGRAGVKPGPYLFIPLFGPTTVRDAIGAGVDVVSNPFHWLFHTSDHLVEGTTVISGLDKRANADSDLKALLSNATDPYATFRSVYLQNQQSKIDDSGGDVLRALPDFDDDNTVPAPVSSASVPATPAPAMTAAP